ncbi:MAG: hypothetical protein EOM24_11680 [Chloroflexia bacterium]|nr:hypothetical protein [Chloroflexia bacterium]
MPFDLRPLFQALLALWSITTSVTSYQGNLLEATLTALGLWPAVSIFFLAGLSETYGTRAVVLFLNRLGRRPFFLTLLLTAITYVIGGFVWALTIDLVGAGLLGITGKFPVMLQAVAIGYIPLLFAFLAVIPYLGPAILHLIQGLSFIFTASAVSIGFGVRFREAVLCTIIGWLVFQLLRWFAAGPTTAISRWVLRVVTGREVNYQLRDVVPTVPLGLQRHRHTLEDGGER